MSSELPLWFGRERGTDLSALVEWEEEEALESGGNDFAVGLLGLLAPLALLALALSAMSLPLVASIGLIALGVLWFAAGSIAGAATALTEDPPVLATVFSQILVTIGKIIAFASLLFIVIFAVAMLLGLVAAVFASDS
jgi:hypothetical protein